MVNERHMRLIFSRNFGHRVQENTDRASVVYKKAFDTRRGGRTILRPNFASKFYD